MLPLLSLCQAPRVYLILAPDPGTNLVAICLILRVMHPLPPMIRGTFLCLSIILFVNKFKYWLAERGVEHKTF